MSKFAKVEVKIAKQAKKARKSKEKEEQRAAKKAEKLRLSKEKEKQRRQKRSATDKKMVSLLQFTPSAYLFCYFLSHNNSPKTILWLGGSGRKKHMYVRIERRRTIF